MAGPAASMSDRNPGAMPLERPDANRQPDQLDARSRADVRRLPERPARTPTPITSDTGTAKAPNRSPCALNIKR